MKSIFQRAFRGSLASSISTISTLVQAVLSVSILLSEWGEGRYAVWIASNSLLSLLAILDGGHHTYVGNIVNHKVQIDPRAANEAVRAGIWASLTMGGLFVFTCILILQVGDVGALLSVEHKSLKDEFGDALWVGALGWLGSGAAGGLLDRVYPAIGAFARAQWIGILRGWTAFVLLALVVKSGGGLVSAMTSQVVVHALFRVYVILDLAKTVPGMLGARFEKDLLLLGLKNFRRALGYSFASILDQSMTNGTALFVVSRFPEGATSFITIRTISNIGLQIINVICSPIASDVASSVAQKSTMRCLFLIRMAFLFSMGLLAVGFLATSPFIERIHFIWTKSAVDFDTWLYALLIVSVLFRVGTAPAGLLFSAINDIPYFVKSSLYRFLGALLGAVVSFETNTIWPMALGLMCGEILAAFISFYRFRIQLGPEVVNANKSEIRRAALLPIIISLGLLLWAPFGNSALLLAAIVSWIVLLPDYKLLKKLPGRLYRLRLERD